MCQNPLKKEKRQAFKCALMVKMNHLMHNLKGQVNFNTE